MYKGATSDDVISNYDILHSLINVYTQLVHCNAVTIKKDGKTVGHVLQKMSKLCTLLLERNSMILCTVTRPRLGLKEDRNCLAC